MKEYWVNVYERIPVINPHSSKDNAIQYASNEEPVAYRIHIKMKDKPGLLMEYRYNFMTGKSGTEILMRQQQRIF